MTAPLQECEIREPWLLKLPPRLRDALAWTVLTGICSLYYIIPVAYISVVALLLTGRLMASATVAAVLATLSMIPMRPWPAARRAAQIFYPVLRVRHNASAERVKVLMKEWHDGDRYILGMHPHGVVPLQAFVWCAFCDQYLRNDEWGTLYGFGGMATSVTRLGTALMREWSRVILMPLPPPHRLPVLRTLLGWLSGTAARYSILKRGLSAGQNLYMLPGGLAEIFTAAPGTHTAVWRSRRGLVRLSLETGARLTPVFVFGGNELFFQFLTSNSRLARASRRFGASVTFFWGRWWWFPVVPRTPPHGMTIALGDPLPSRRAAAKDGVPTPAEIEALSKEYEEALVALFEAYKAEAGDPEGKLVVI